VNTDFDSALAAFDRHLAQDETSVAWPSQLLHDGEKRSRVFVLLHGLTASPQQFAPLGRLLKARGGNVLIPRLPFHGHGDRLTETLVDLRSEHLHACIDESLEIARGLGDRITVAGFSLGGLLACWSAQWHPIDHAVAIAPFLGVAGTSWNLSSRIARLVQRLPNTFLWWNPFLRERQLPEHGYPRYPTWAAAQSLALAQALADEVTRAAPNAARITLIANARETAVSNRAIRSLFKQWYEAGANVSLTHLRGLPPSHDIIEAEQKLAVRETVYPSLLALMDPEAEY
jgi:carboxylesterase